MSGRKGCFVREWQVSVNHQEGGGQKKVARPAEDQLCSAILNGESARDISVPLHIVSDHVGKAR
jgi:hypothetical protein